MFVTLINLIVILIFFGLFFGLYRYDKVKQEKETATLDERQKIIKANAQTKGFNAMMYTSFAALIFSDEHLYLHFVSPYVPTIIIIIGFLVSYFYQIKHGVYPYANNAKVAKKHNYYQLVIGISLTLLSVTSHNSNVISNSLALLAITILISAVITAIRLRHDVKVGE